MAEDPDHAALKQLEDRIDALKKAQEPPPAEESHYSQASLGWRMVIELVSGLGVGFAIGYGLDVLLGTLPVFLVVFVLLGFAAGVRVMLRTADEVRAGGTGAGAESTAAQAARGKGN